MSLPKSLVYIFSFLLWMCHLHVVMKKIYNFPQKSELSKFILQVKISWLIFFFSFRGGNELAHFLILYFFTQNAKQDFQSYLWAIYDRVFPRKP